MFQTLKKSLSLLSISLLATGALLGCQSQPMPNLQTTLQPASLAQRQSLLQRSPQLGIFSANGPKVKRKLGLRLTPNRRRVRLAPEDLIPFEARKPGQGLPAKVDLRQWASPVDDQGDLGACTGFSIKAIRELMLIRDGQPLTTLSPLFLYYYERKREGTVDEDAGAMITTGMEVLQKVGVAREALWSYDPSNDNNPVTKEKFQVAPSAEAYSDARKYRVKSFKPLDTLRDIRYELAHRNPVVIGIEVFEAFYNTPDGHLPKPNPKEPSQGGHAVAVVGYDDAQKVLIVKNSWGTGWGDQGYFYLPYDYVKLGLASEALTAY